MSTARAHLLLGDKDQAKDVINRATVLLSSTSVPPSSRLSRVLGDLGLKINEM